MRGWFVALVLTAASAGSLSSCGKNEKPPPPLEGATTGQESGPRGSHGSVAGSGAVAATVGGAAMGSGEPPPAEKMFMTVCATCHGQDGSGNGPVAESLNPKPRNYTDKAWQASVTDEDLKKIIVGGGHAVGKSPMMPANPGLKDQPEVLDGLVQIIRRFGK